MPAKLRFRRPSHATVVAYLALFVALGGTGAYAANTVFSTDIVDGEVKTPDLASVAVTNAKVATNAVTAGKIATNAVTTGKVADNNLTGTDIANTNSIGPAEIAGLGGADIADNSLTGADITDQSGVDTCVLSTRVGQLCVRVENFARAWTPAFLHCANLDLRLPTLSEAMELVRTHDIPDADQQEYFWTQDQFQLNSNSVAQVVRDDGLWGNTTLDTPLETVCVTTPTN
jgi:hypothetical protein